jgi:signal transduction histidine kinase
MPYAALVCDAELAPVMVNKLARTMRFETLLPRESATADGGVRYLYSDGTPYTEDSPPLLRAITNSESFFGLTCIVPGDQERTFLVDVVPLSAGGTAYEGALLMGRELNDGGRSHYSDPMIEAPVQLPMRDTPPPGAFDGATGQPCATGVRAVPMETHSLLVKRSIEAIEDDRKLVAKELHDSIGASLAAIKLYLEEQQSTLNRLSQDLPVSLEKPIDYLIKTIKETKRISVKMSPLMLDELGLLATVQWYSREFGGLYPQMSLVHHLDIDENDIPQHHKITLFRILQEAANNAAKHGQAKTLLLSLRKTGDHILFGIEDDGCGFDPQRIKTDDDNVLSGFGIAGMRDRVELAGGVFELSSHLGRGTRIRILLSCTGSGRGDKPVGT